MIVIREATLRRGTKVVLERASVTLNPGDKVGLVGRNGAGKSSLFALLAGRLHTDAGDVELPASWRLGEVAQSMPDTDQPATEFVLDGDTALRDAQARVAAADALGDGHAIAEAHLELEHAGGFDARPRAQSLLLGLGFKPVQIEAPLATLSGGWRMRAQLARALMCPADLLLLDEPTNHLDLDALVWLESWLQRFPGTLIVISHDREFLDAITRVTLHIDERQLTRWTGNYSAFEAARASAMAQAQSAYARQQERIAQLQRFIDRFKAKATKARQAQSRVKALERMERLAPVLTANDFAFEFREPAGLPNPMLVLRDVDCGYTSPPVAADCGDAAPQGLESHFGQPGAGLAETLVVRGVVRTVHAGQRIGILGANGQGKSTLVKTVAGTLPALGGVLTRGKGLAIGYFAQHEMDLLHADDTPLQQMTRLARQHGVAPREQDLRNFLGQFAFSGDMVHQSVATLSGGERARLVLATIVWQRPNLLLLDEPTNHLDLTTREALSLALNEFEGAVMLVSHDRALLREVCDEFWLVTGGSVDAFDGDLDDYQRWLLDVARARTRGTAAPTRPGAVATPAPAPPAGTRIAAASTPNAASPAATRRDDRRVQARSRARLAEQTRPLRTEIEQIEARLAKLNSERGESEAALSGGPLAPADIAEAGRRLNHIAAETAVLEGRWLELHGQLEALTNSAGA